jgi:micrococcal nuclease
MKAPDWVRFWSPEAWRAWQSRHAAWRDYQSAVKVEGSQPESARPPRPVSPGWISGALLVGLVAIAPGGAPSEPDPPGTGSETTLTATTVAGTPTTISSPRTTTTNAVVTTVAAAVSDPLLARPVPNASGDPEGPFPDGAEPVTVGSITDGDTIDVIHQDGTIGTVRLIGINTPESNECFAGEAAAALGVLTPVGATVGMTVDVSDVDQYGRLLRYLWLGAMSVNEEMVRRGAGISRRYQPDTAMADRLEAAQLEAQESRLGLWSLEACGPRAEVSLDVVAIEYNPPGNENDNLNDEWVMIRNDSDTLADLTGWTIKDESASNRFAFPSGFALAPGESVTIHSGCGQDLGAVLHWCSVGAAIWNNDGDTVFLLDPSGNIHTTHAYDGNR